MIQQVNAAFARRLTSTLDAMKLSGQGIDLGRQDEITTRIIKIGIIAILAVGLLTRLSPLLDVEGRLFWQFMTEDGYLMQTVARNMAIGLGMSVSEGTMPTNGVQPLATFLFAGLHWLAGGERYASIALVTLASATIAAGGAYFLSRLASALLVEVKGGEILARIIAAVWFTGSLTTAHSMNGLETGLYALVLLATLLFYVERLGGTGDAPRFGASIALGLLLGVTFLARNDAVFFIASLLLAHLCVGDLARHRVQNRFMECLVAGSLSVVVALPWLVNNYRLFGSLVPISGISQSFAAAFGENLLLVPANLVEASLPFLAIPRRLEDNVLVALVSVLLIAGVLASLWQTWARGNEVNRRIYVAMVLFGVGLAGYYGLFFGAAHFISRYLSILSPFLWFATALVGFFWLTHLLGDGQRIRWAVAAAVPCLLVYSVVLGAYAYANGRTHMHKQVVDWVSANVPPGQWVGAVQTGTLGYFYDRTLNLDGKVNPDVLRSLLRDGHSLEYVSDSPIRFIVDWVGMADWVRHPKANRFKSQFEVVVRDNANNLAVLRRK